jgi:hypothetical protein
MTRMDTNNGENRDRSQSGLLAVGGTRVADTPGCRTWPVMQAVAEPTA